jgi:hypothetical protein
MAIHDHERRTVDDYMRHARNYEDARPPSLLGIAAGIAFILFMIYVFATGSPNRPQRTELPNTPTATPTAPMTQPQ